MPLCVDYLWHVSNSVTLLQKQVVRVTNIAGLRYFAGHHRGTAAIAQNVAWSSSNVTILYQWSIYGRPLSPGRKWHVIDTTTFMSLESIVGTSFMIGTWHRLPSIMLCMPFSLCWYPWPLYSTIHCWALPVCLPISSRRNKHSQPFPDLRGTWIAWKPSHLIGMFLSTAYEFVRLSHLSGCFYLYCHGLVIPWLVWPIYPVHPQCNVFVHVEKQWQ